MGSVPSNAVSRHLAPTTRLSPRRRSDPTFKQFGYPVRFAQWSALVVPTGTPDDAIRKLRAAAAKVAADANVRQVIAKAGSLIEYLDAPEFQTYWDADAAEMTKAVRAMGKGE